MRGGDLDEALAVAGEIVRDVRARGDAALLEWTERLDGELPGSLRVQGEAIGAAEVDAEALDAIRRLAGAVCAFHEPQRPPDTSVEAFPGVRAERRWLPLDSVGIYVPGGKAVLASSLVMAAVPAQVAGVRRIVVVSPRPAAAVLATARELGLDEIYAVGGAQAVAALAYGTASIPRVDKIVGPGNRFVTAAKLLVSSHVGIDLPAGPSEVMILADESADPELVAADLRAQAEHGPDSESVLVTTSTKLAEAVRARVGDDGRIRIEHAAHRDGLVRAAVEYAPEHLELMVADPDSLLEAGRNAGTVFVGDYAPAVLGDYAAGATHVLPTGGLARGAGGLGLETFLKPVQFVRATPEGLEGVRDVVGALARLEGLPLHGAAVELRANMLPR